jgi:DNA invertase Pin-like site-specific DNA recombinase
LVRETAPMRLGLYARVSTHEQQTLTLQRDAMVAYAQQRHGASVMTVEEVGAGYASVTSVKRSCGRPGDAKSMPLSSGGWTGGVGP